MHTYICTYMHMIPMQLLTHVNMKFNTVYTTLGPPPENITVNTSASISLLVGWNESSVTTTNLSSYQVIFREEFGNEMDAIILNQTNLQNRYARTCVLFVCIHTGYLQFQNYCKKFKHPNRTINPQTPINN